MPSKDYQVVFRGRLTPETTESLAAQNMAKLFSVAPEKVLRLFDGQRHVIKKGLDRETADKYRRALRKAGIIVAVVSAETERAAQTKPEVVAPPAQPAETQNRASFAIDDPHRSTQRAVFRVDDPADASPPPADVGGAAPAADSPTAGSDADLAPVGSQLVEPQTISAPDFDLRDFTLADIDALVDESPPPPPLEVDVSDLSAEEGFDALDSSPPPPPPDVDISKLDLAEDDGPVDKTAPPPPAQIDTDGLSASESFEQLDDRPPPPAAQISTDHLDSD
ncbi:MAG: hypothetical protein AAGA23_08535 [Pseudomonadota bacterium]